MTIEERYELIEEVQLQLGIMSGNPLKIVKIKKLVKQYYGNIDNEKEFVDELTAILHPQIPKEEIKYHDANEQYHILDLIDISTIQTDVSEKDDIEALCLSAEPMIKQGYFTENYSKTVLRQYINETNQIVIAPGIALPHTTPISGVIKCGLGISVLNELVLFNNKYFVNYIFYLSPLDYHSHIPAMSEFLELIGDSKFLELLDNAQSPLEIFDYIHLIHAKD